MFTESELLSDFLVFPPPQISNVGERSVLLFKFLFWAPQWAEFNFPFVDYVGSVHPGADYFLAVTS